MTHHHSLPSSPPQLPDEDRYIEQYAIVLNGGTQTTVFHTLGLDISHSLCSIVNEIASWPTLAYALSYLVAQNPKQFDGRLFAPIVLAAR